MPADPSQDQAMNTTPPITAKQQLLASCTGAVITSLTMTPFDVIKNRLQAQNQPQVCLAEDCGSAFVQTASQDAACPSCGTPQHRIRFRGTMDAFLKIGQVEGIPSLWRGMVPTLVMSVPGTVVYFSLYDQIRPFMGDSRYAPAACGSFARIFAATIVSPLEMLRTKMQASQGVRYSEAFSVIRRTIHNEGWRSLYRGLNSTLMRDVPFSAIYWTGYELLRRRLGEWLHPDAFSSSTPPIDVAFSAGALAGSTAAIITLPFDVVKTRQQSLLGQAILTGRSAGSTKESVFFIIKDIYATYGWRGLFAGITPRVAKVAPACAIMISSYEFFKQFFREKNSHV
eukprot:m.45668 g.45668  ORF g.45668 m.45668 type:complete len:341 (+) comp12194_c0_seq2:435-1457(+)